MRSRPYELARRALAVLSYCGRESRDGRLDETTRAVLAACGRDVLAVVNAAVSALDGDDHHATRRDLARARRRLGIADQMTAGGIVPRAQHGDRP